MKMNNLLLSAFLLSLLVGGGFVHVVYAEQGKASAEGPGDVQKWDIELYGQKFTLIPSLYDDSEQEGGPQWEAVRHHVVKLLPDAFEGKHQLSRKEILDGVEKLKNSYNELLYTEVRRMAVELIDAHPAFIVADDKHGAKRYEEFQNMDDKSAKIDAMEFAIAEMFKSNTWRAAVKSYQKNDDKSLTQFYFLNGYTFFEYAYALEYLHGMLQASPEMRDVE